AGALGGVDGEFAVVAKGVESAAAQEESFVDKFVRGFLSRPRATDLFIQDANDDFHIVFSEAIQAQFLGGCENFAVGAHFGVAVLGGPFGDFGVEAFAILD